MASINKIAILGGGNMGLAFARGLVKSGKFKPEQITLTRRMLRNVEAIQAEGFPATRDNAEAIKGADAIVLAVLPQQVNNVLDDIKSTVDVSSQFIISLISGVTSSDIKGYLNAKIPVVIAMPNTAIAIQQSMTCLAATNNDKKYIDISTELFNTVGETVTIDEGQMTAATALCACGVAFFLRSIRAASQGGTEIGFHSHDALKMAVQVARGAAELLHQHNSHPEDEIDKVTSPKGCTIAGLNEMEHQGFSSAMIKGIILANDKAGTLYKK